MGMHSLLHKMSKSTTHTHDYFWYSECEDLALLQRDNAMFLWSKLVSKVDSGLQSTLNGISPLCIISWRQKGLQGIWIRREQCQAPKNFQAASIARLLNVLMWNKTIHKGCHCLVKENDFKSWFFKKCGGLFPVRTWKEHWKFQILIGWEFFFVFIFFSLHWHEIIVY